MSKFIFQNEENEKKDKKNHKDNGSWEISDITQPDKPKAHEVSVPEGHDGGPIQKRKYKKKHIVSQPPTSL